MLNLNKTAVAVLVALGSSAVSAGTMGPVCTPGCVTVPCEANGWDVGVGALYLDPTFSGDYGYIGREFITPVAGAGTEWREWDRNYHWGFKLDGSYHFCTGNDITATWYHFDRNRGSDSFFYDLSPIAFAVPAFYSRDTKWDQVDLVMGQRIDAGKKTIRLFAGVEWASIRSNDNIDVPVFGTVAAFNQYRYSNFRGFGARVGTNLKYNWDCGVYAGADVAAAILSGTSRFDHSASSLVLFAGSPFTAGSRRALVPELETKLSLGYLMNWDNCNLDFKVGYMWFNYFNALHSVDLDRAIDLVPPQHFQSDFGVHGVFLELKYTSMDGLGGVSS